MLKSHLHKHPFVNRNDIITYLISQRICAKIHKNASDIHILYVFYTRSITTPLSSPSPYIKLLLA